MATPLDRRPAVPPRTSRAAAGPAPPRHVSLPLLLVTLCAVLLVCPPLANASAVKNDRISVLDYADLVESPRNPAAIGSLAAYLKKVTS